MPGSCLLLNELSSDDIVNVIRHYLEQLNGRITAALLSSVPIPAVPKEICRLDAGWKLRKADAALPSSCP